MPSNTIAYGDCRSILFDWLVLGAKVQMCVTSPPYWGLRDYGVAGQLGMEKTPDEYVAKMVEVFRIVRGLLADDGTLWLNIGDSYAASGRGGGGNSLQHDDVGTKIGLGNHRRAAAAGYKEKDLVGIPWLLAFALRADGWYLRQDIIWSKPNPMPESVRDRCTRAHEYLFLLSKSPRYYFDGDAIAQECKPSTVARIAQQNLPNQHGSDRVPGKTNGPMKACFGGRIKSIESRKHTRLQSGREDDGNYLERGANKRSVWTVTTKPFKGAHFATFPPDLIEPCILAGSRPNDIVLDPFMGSGTTAQVALAHGRRYLGCELNPAYRELADARIASVTPDAVAVAAD